MGQFNDQEQDELSLLGGNLVLTDVSLIANDLVLDGALRKPLHYSEAKPHSYTVELFWDEARVTATELLYGETVYPLENIDSLQIQKLHRRRSVIKKKLSNFLVGVIMSIGLGFLFSPLPWPFRLLDLILIMVSISYAVYFNWWIEQRRRGEFGLVMTMKVDSQVVITSHSLKAIQALYQIMFRRLDLANPADESLMVNMYTGETVIAE
ncbi:hypothetical protein [Leptothoe sp. PORK10 BA2]|uniref:hypothetical protein n=1 Tax=Leptothoe sp. PORK10 BA2 TaxID=3110254 RepID=UPI002B20EB7D|nr:hypothetical protein [Leptothoe sp. PORK10 BA2]MEA5465329.1 hypothetical protein [Leptothoe sp. PORK10 BA2]